jgi:4-amino-4-deoxy-L-arabinose transferase-like glycosyltransferase
MKALAAVLAGQLLLGTLFALHTPAWDNPDEPAHYNAVAELAGTGRLPVLEPGDYDQGALTRAVASGFPEGPRGAFLHYEDHQPPLYYLLMVPLFLATDGSLAALRLGGVVLGTMVALCTWASARLLFPRRPGTAGAAAAFAAFLPQHLAGTASVNNDALLVPLVALGLLLAIRERQDAGGVRRLSALGLVAGLALLTKLTALPLLVAAVAAASACPRRRGSRLVALLVPVVVLVGPLLLRNVSVYGGGDPLALRRHGTVVAGQPTAGEWIQARGFRGFVSHGVATTFRSFWAQFGWMGVVVDFRFYLAAFTLTLAAGVGLAGGEDVAPARAGGGLLALHAGLVALLFAAYNFQFVQPQGRYLFPALLPIAVGVARGLENLADRNTARRAALALAAAAACFLFHGLLARDVPGWTLLFLGAAAAALAGLARGADAPRRRLVFLPIALMPLVSAFLLFRYIPG